MDKNKMDIIHVNPYHITDIKDLKINGENVTSISENTNNIIYVSKDGNDETGNGSFGNPFFTINHANDYAITLLNSIVDWNESIIIKVNPGKYEEQIVNSHRRIYIVGDGKDFENWPKPVILYNTGADAAHYPIGCKEYLNLSEIQIEVDSGGVFCELVNRGLFSNCVFEGGAFIEQTTPVDLTTYYNFCLFEGGKGFDLSGTVDADRFIALRKCDFMSTDAKFGSSGTGEKTIKFDKSMMGTDSTTISGNWSLLFYSSEKYDTTGRLIIDTDGEIDIFASIITYGIHFISDTLLDKKVVNCLFKDTPTGEGDITGDIPVEFIQYSGNHQHNGIDGEVITVSKIKNVGGGQNNYRNIYEALKGSLLQDTIINLEGDVEVSEPLIINQNIDIQIDGNKKWVLNSTHATTLCELGEDQQLSFVNMKSITGGKKLIMNGDNAKLSLVSCGRYTEPNYINIEITAGNTNSFIYLVKTCVIGTSAPAIKDSDVDVEIMMDRSCLMGGLNNAAILYTVAAHDITKIKNSTIMHGGGTATEAIDNTSGTKIDSISVYGTAFNAAIPTAKFANSIVNASNVVDSGIDF